MNKYTEQQIEKQLNKLASIKPSEDSLRRTNRNVRNIITGGAKKPTATRRFFYYALASAAMLMVGISLLYHRSTAPIQPEIVRQMPTEPTLTLANLNAVFQNGGQKALDEYFEKVESNRQPQADSLTLQDIMKEL